MGVRHVLGGLVLQVSSAISNAMLGTVGLASFVILFKRRTLAIAAAILCFTPVAVSGMFNPGYPMLALALGAAMIVIFVFVIVRVGLLGAIAALATHFILLRAPLTTHLSTWWATDRYLVSGNRRRDRIRRVLHRARVNGGRSPRVATQLQGA